jgi:hypothetical protein
MELDFWPHAGILGTKSGPRQPRSAHPLQAKVDLRRPAQDMIDVVPQPADMRQAVARTAVRAVGVSSGASQWLCQASA